MRRGRLRTVHDCCYHITHRCHQGSYLLRFKYDRRNYLKRLREGTSRAGVDVLDYVVTSNHYHLLLWAESGRDVSAALQYSEGTAARAYNRRKKRRGAFWADRFHPTLVQTGSHLSRCICYIGLNMVRAKAVAHPSEWESAGYRELAGLATGNAPLINIERLLWSLNMPEQEDQFRAWYVSTLDEMGSGYLSREPWWSEAAAVGSREWVDRLAETIVVGRCEVTELPTSFTSCIGEDGGSYALHTGRRMTDALMSWR